MTLRLLSTTVEFLDGPVLTSGGMSRKFAVFAVFAVDKPRHRPVAPHLPSPFP